MRNGVAHGIWIHDQNTGSLSLQRISGAWEISGKVADSKKNTPESVQVSSAWFDEQAARIVKCIHDTQQLDREVAGLTTGS